MEESDFHSSAAYIMFRRFVRLLIRFSFHQLELRGRYYVPLPKLTLAQLEIIEKRLKNLGFNVGTAGGLIARSGGTTITVQRKGLCWSNNELEDIVAPAIPSILDERKKEVSFGRLCREYFWIKKIGNQSVLRFLPRLESFSNWDVLRATGALGVTPDERAVFSYLLSRPGVEVRTLTDYPKEAYTSKMIGGRQYFSCRIPGSELAAHLGDFGMAHPRNAFLPRDGTMVFPRGGPSVSRLASILHGLGEWCFLTPKSRKL